MIEHFNKLDALIAEAVLLQQRISAQGKISCAQACKTARELGEPLLKIGKMLNKLNIRLCQCQLGLFAPKIVKSAQIIPADIEKKIKTIIRKNRISCADLWSIAEESGIEKQHAADCCEALEIKIKHCSFGAF